MLNAHASSEFKETVTHTNKTKLIDVLLVPSQLDGFMIHKLSDIFLKPHL